ncbi:DedA family protein [Devosia sp. A16]|uniref:DedA family protein n=1 Tax=Devosia sp. A16 TaxID=1736675 RepID=UPI0006D8322C|nr:VTT domain-containing protein [Devosia sp. A16]
MDIVNDYVLGLAASPWIYLIAFGLIAVDGFFPPFPSESVVVALAALSAAGRGPDIGLLLAAAAAGAIAGDNVAYLGGRAIGRGRLLQLRFRPLVRLVGWAEAGLAARPGTLFLAARYVPLGRFGVNLTAGAVEYPFRHFLPWSVAAGASWAAYTVAVGFAAGKWFEAEPLVGMLVAIGVAFALGWLLDLAIGLVRRRRVGAGRRQRDQ